MRCINLPVRVTLLFVVSRACDDVIFEGRCEGRGEQGLVTSNEEAQEEYPSREQRSLIADFEIDANDGASYYV